MASKEKDDDNNVVAGPWVGSGAPPLEEKDQVTCRLSRMKATPRAISACLYECMQATNAVFSEEGKYIMDVPSWGVRLKAAKLAMFFRHQQAEEEG